jgi:hypothetical protein
LKSVGVVALAVVAVVAVAVAVDDVVAGGRLARFVVVAGL